MLRVTCHLLIMGQTKPVLIVLYNRQLEVCTKASQALWIVPVCYSSCGQVSVNEEPKLKHCQIERKRDQRIYAVEISN